MRIAILSGRSTRSSNHKNTIARHKFKLKIFHQRAIELLCRVGNGKYFKHAEV
ncbi:MAG: hypothetical protein HC942_20220 [Microcoleus sp. SU_5_6]|nr:hypothetical protein [Microcoleus sp. SU_5_6]NJL67338.1 hypothetical protein [Microcoleus sp. SM1_3_4]